MRRLAGALFIGILIAAGCASSEDDAGSTLTTATSDSPTGAVAGDLMVQNATDARFTASDDGSYQLTLTGVDAEVVWFSDRPARQAGTESTADLITEFFTEPSPDGPPNAAVVWSTDGDEQVLAVTLQEGAVDADSGDVTYSVTLLETSSGALADFGPNADVPTSPTGPISLYIDSVFHHEVCQNTFFNALEHNLDLGTWNAYDKDDYAPPNVLFPGQWSPTWAFTADGLDEDCGGGALYSSSEGLFDYTFNNGNTKANSWKFLSCTSATCVVVNVSNNYVLTNYVIICEASLSQEECIAKTQ